MSIARRRIGTRGDGNPHISKFRVPRALFNRLVEEADAQNVSVTVLIRSILEETYRPPELDVKTAMTFLTENGFEVSLTLRKPVH
jgi:hypothetical protein